MTIQEQLCDRVYELLPEKKELGFGCEIEALIGDDIMWADFETGKVMYECGMCTKHKRQSSCSADCDIKDALGVLFGSDENGYCIVTIVKSDKYKIIGQRLGIAELLLAIKIAQSKYISLSSPEISITTDGQIIDDSKNHSARFTGINYNLSQDNLLNQSNELCELCLGLLNK